MNGGQRTDAENILGELMSFSGIDFVRLPDNYNADLIFYIAEVEDFYNAQAGGTYQGADTALGIGMQPGGDIRIKDPITGVDRLINQRPGLVVIDDDLPSFDTITKDGQTIVRSSGNGSLFKAALLRHIGEAIGLYQPGFEEVYRTEFDNTGKFTSNYYTSMSDKRENLPSTTFNEFGNYNWGYMPHDIAAIQQMYDVLEPNLFAGGRIDPSARSDSGQDWNYGNSTNHPWATFFNNIRTVWDIAGNDTFDFSPSSVAVTIDLRPGFNSSVGDNGTTNNIAIAFGTDIENAVGSIYSDTIVGNDLDNNITGNRGDDSLSGGQGTDIFRITLGWGKDTIMDLSQITDPRGNTRDLIDLRPLKDDEAEFITELRKVFALQTTDLADGAQDQKTYTSGIVSLKYFNGDAIVSYGVLGTQLLDQIIIKHVDLVTAADFIIP
jgi:Peptidase M10 serralysin C terminal